jgi:hypothetical protein
VLLGQAALEHHLLVRIASTIQATAVALEMAPLP